VKGNAAFGYGSDVWGTFDVVWRQSFDGPWARWRLYLHHDSGSAVDSDYWKAYVREENSFSPDPIYCTEVYSPATISRQLKTAWSPSKYSYKYCSKKITKTETWHDDLGGFFYSRGTRFTAALLHTGHWKSYYLESIDSYRLEYTSAWY
jgi:hypothetical protein